MKSKLSGNVLRGVLFVAVAAVLAWGSFAVFGKTAAPVAGMLGHDHEGEGKRQLYICPMNCIDPQPEPGRCPVCSMDLVPMPEGTLMGDPDKSMVLLSDEQRALADVEMATVERRAAMIELRLSGKIGYDETRQKVISAWAPGRLEKVYVDNTGTYVKEGQPLVELYSKQLNSEKAIYLATLHDKPVGDMTKERRKELNRARLKLLGLTDGQIDAMEKRGKPKYAEDILAPISGTVISKSALAGMYVKEGQQLYEIADLSRLWVWLDAYESDLPFIRYGQKVEITTPAFGNEKFDGTVSFVEPVLSAMTRTARVRVQVDNPQLKLRPNMLVRAVIYSRISQDGAVLADDWLKGKWICPRHPEIVKDEPGVCDISGLKLVQADKLGYYNETADKAEDPLLVPASAVLYTGKRGFVYKLDKYDGQEVFAGVDVDLGPRAGDYYIVRSGLKDGDRVAANGAFRIDSAVQLSGRPSMMARPQKKAQSATFKQLDTPQEPVQKESPLPDIQRVEVPQEYQQELAGVFIEYIHLQNALASDDAVKAKEVITRLQNVTGALPLAKDGSPLKWNKERTRLHTLALLLGRADEDIVKQRQYFSPLSWAMMDAVLRYGLPEKFRVWRVYCPMAFGDNGAYWLQDNDKVFNPYEGSRMPTCGFVKEQINGN